MDFQQICYLTWGDPGGHRKYVVIEQDEQLKAIKGRVIGTFTNHSNYICIDSQKYNQHVTDF
ncbi:hypothetical protein J22TS1_37830 [Siminovitchia terrae]|nr:hypothetical protein J22TS1_37830 [Siminovitchia terrae]